MNSEVLAIKLLDLAEGRETPESWRSWWDEHEPELENLLSRGEFLKLKPCRHDFRWVPVLTSQKGAIAILEKSGTAFEVSNLYQERYLAELDAFCKEQERVQRKKQKEFKANNPELFGRYPKFSKALAKVLDLAVCTVAAAEGVVHISISQRSQLLAELGHVLGLFLAETGVLQQNEDVYKRQEPGAICSK